MCDKGNFEIYTGINREPVEVIDLLGVNLGDLVITLAREHVVAFLGRLR